MQNPSPVETYKTLLLIWFALLFSQVTLLIAVFFAKPEVFRFDSSKPFFFGESPVLPLAFVVLALVNFGLSFFMKRRAFAQAVETQKVSYVQTGLIIAFAFCESISLIGVVLAIAFAYQYFFLWIAFGILGIVLHFPRRDDVMAASYKK
jgi:hypothetical protein